ncbi:MAG: flavin reductase [Bacteroidales bacterium]|nr:flavin reductase [Bacteroidales bacterium]
MSKEFKKISPQQLNDNVFDLIGEEWMLITAGTPDHFNTMTASWGTMGILWHLPVAVCFIRPQRHTFKFAESSDYYTLCFLEPGNRDILQFCGTRSGQDTDKINETGLKPLTTELGNVYYEQCRLVIECKKLYADRIREDAFIIPELIVKNYPRKDFHKFYIGEIVSCLVPA